jgi:hypothetical protein
LRRDGWRRAAKSDSKHAGYGDDQQNAKANRQNLDAVIA